MYDNFPEEKIIVNEIKCFVSSGPNRIRIDSRLTIEDPSVYLLSNSGARRFDRGKKTFMDFENGYTIEGILDEMTEYRKKGYQFFVNMFSDEWKREIEKDDRFSIEYREK